MCLRPYTTLFHIDTPHELCAICTVYSIVFSYGVSSYLDMESAQYRKKTLYVCLKQVPSFRPRQFHMKIGPGEKCRCV